MRKVLCAKDACGGFAASMIAALLCAGIAAGSASAAPANNPTAENNGLEEIVVTAEKRESTVQATAISITALSAGDLAQENIVNVEDLVGKVPGISLRTAGPGQTEYEMRGLSSGGGTAATVGFYIDETPLWRDGTVASASPMTGMQKRIWWLAVAGKFFEGLVVFMTGVALPLIGKEFNLTSTQHGIVSAASLFGILIGASALGGLSDRYGRKPMFIIEMALFVLFLIAIVFSQSFVWLIVCLFGMGLALGCDYWSDGWWLGCSLPAFLALCTSLHLTVLLISW